MLLQDYRVRRAIEGIIAEPLRNEGIDCVAVVDHQVQHVLLSIERADAVYFKAPSPEDETLQSDEYVDTLQVLTLAFQDGNKWRFTEGGGVTYYAVVQDEVEHRSAAPMVQLRMNFAGNSRTPST